MAHRIPARRDVLKMGGSTAAVALFGLLPRAVRAGESSDTERMAPVHPEFPRQESAAVREVVGASHRDLERVKALVMARPALATATWDWGFGDWESALGAASHTGQREIALLLMEHGARPDVFTLAMLGNLDAVRAILQHQPNVATTRGPHGISLLAHAEAGADHPLMTESQKKESLELVAYLTSLSPAVEEPAEVSSEQKAMYTGRYDFGDGDDEYLLVDVDKRGRLTITRAEQSVRNLTRVGDDAFHPAGAPKVRIQFAVNDGVVGSLTVHDPEPIVRAIRK